MSRMRSPVTSRSNWAKDKSTFRVSRPIEVVVLNCCVIDTKETPCAIEDVHDLGEVRERAGQPVDLVDDHRIDLTGLDVGEEPLQRRALHGAARDTAIVVQSAASATSPRASGCRM